MAVLTSGDAAPRGPHVCDSDTAWHGTPEEVCFAAEEAEVAVQQGVNGVLPWRRAAADGGRHSQQLGVEALQVSHGV